MGKYAQEPSHGNTHNSLLTMYYYHLWQCDVQHVDRRLAFFKTDYLHVRWMLGGSGGLRSASIFMVKPSSRGSRQSRSPCLFARLDDTAILSQTPKLGVLLLHILLLPTSCYVDDR